MVTPETETEIDNSPVSGSMTSVVDTEVLPDGEYTYVVEAVLSDDEETVTPRSNPRTVTVFNVAPVLIAFQRTETWLTTSSSNRKFDIKAQVLRNGVVVAEREITDITVGLGSSFNKAVYTQIQPLIPATASAFTTQDTLSVRLSIKLSPSSGGGNQASAEVRLWYNTPGNNSRLRALRAGTAVSYNLVTGFKLQQTPTQAQGGSQYVSLNVRRGEPYREFGVWSITGP